MKESTYDPQWRELLESTDTPLSASELTARTGGSRARVHVWVRDNQPNLVEIGKNAKGARTYVWRTNPLVRQRRNQTTRTNVQPETPTQEGITDGVRIGAVLTVTSMHVSAGRVWVELTDASGMVHEAELRL